MLSKTVSICSLLLCLCAVAMGIDYQALSKNYASAHTKWEKLHVLKQFSDSNPTLSDDDNALYSEIQAAINDSDHFSPAKVQKDIDQRAADTHELTYDPKVEEKVKQIKSNRFYKDNGDQSNSNWLAKAFESLFNRKMPDQPQPAAVDMPVGGGGAVFIYIVIALLGAALLFLLYLALRHFSWQKKLKRTSSALLEEDEPERTADEWLKLAEGLCLQGRYREAVRCLYLASLLRIDEAKVARFVRSETNWEHLSRIQASPQRPPQLDLLPATRSFDQIWYGHRVRGQADVDQFKLWYEEVLHALHKEAA